MDAHEGGFTSVVNVDSHKNFIPFDNVKMALYKDDVGNMYVNLTDNEHPERSVTINAETVYRVIEIMDSLFEYKANAAVRHSLN